MNPKRQIRTSSWIFLGSLSTSNPSVPYKFMDFLGVHLVKGMVFPVVMYGCES